MTATVFNDILLILLPISDFTLINYNLLKKKLCEIVF